MNQSNQTINHPLQTAAWRDFRKEWGNEILETKYGFITVHKIPLTHYKLGIFQKGPAPTKTMLKELKVLGKKNHLIFIKLEPNIEKNDSLIRLLTQSGAVCGRRLFFPSSFWIDLTKSEEELLKSFSPKTRYNIRVAQRNGVIVKEDNSEDAFKKYLQLTQETAKRQSFYAHTPRYHKLMWQYLKSAGIAHLLTATYQKEVITTWILFVWKNFLYYPYGASTDKYKNVMANNLMMWEAIKFGKKLGLKTFDLWGREIGTGFTRFKEGYNPRIVESLGSWDLIISRPLYRLYRLAENFRWAFLRLRAKLHD